MTPQTVTPRERLTTMVGRLIAHTQTRALADEAGTTDRTEAQGCVMRWVQEDLDAIEAQASQRGAAADRERNEYRGIALFLLDAITSGKGLTPDEAERARVKLEDR